MSESAIGSAAHPAPAAPRGPPPRAGLLLPLGLGLVLAAALSLFLLWSRKASAERVEASARVSSVALGPLVRTVTVQREPAVRQLQLPGEVRAWQQVTLYAKVSGYLKSIRVDKGDRVQKGQLLATLESPDADQQTATAETDLALKKQQSARVLRLSKTGVVSDQELENALAAEKQSLSALRRAQALQGYEEIRAPFAGVITQRYADVGALLPAATGATQSAQPVLDVADLSRVRIWTYLGQDDAAQVRVGDAAQVTFDPRPGEVRTAQVARLSQSLDLRTRTMLTELVLDNRDGAFYPGEFVHAQITIQSRPTAVIPAEALIVRGGKLFVAVIEAGHAKLKAIEVAADDGRTLQIATGLSGGETIAINAGSQVIDGGAVRVDTKNSAPPPLPAAR